MKKEEQIHTQLAEQRRRVGNENDEQRQTRIEDMRCRTCERVNENQPGQRDSIRVKIENDSHDGWA